LEKTMKRTSILIALGLALGAGAGCKQQGMRKPTAGGGAATEQNQTTLGRAELRPIGDNDVSGTVVVREQNGGALQLKGRIRGLEPNSSHTVLLNPAGQCGGEEGGEHLAYLGTVTADANGVANLSVTKDQTSLGVPTEIIGSSLIVRENTTGMNQGGMGGESHGGMGQDQSGMDHGSMGHDQSGMTEDEEQSDSEMTQPETGRQGGMTQPESTQRGQAKQPGQTKPGQVQEGERGFDTGELEQGPDAQQPTTEACAVIVPEQRG
jgi:hypothetical protein